MDTNDEKFFEELVGAKTDADETYKVELAKASAGAIAGTKMKTIASKPEPQAEIHPEPPQRMEITETPWSDAEPEGRLTVDVYQTPSDIVVESAIAGVNPQDIDINATTDSVTIRGARHHEKTLQDEDYLYQECYWGRFARSILLPQEVDPDAAEVMFKSGILTIRLPKVNKKKSKKLKVRVD